MKTMYKLDEVKNLIQQGHVLALAADEKLLKQLPKGKWIGGTIPYFMSERGGIISADEIQVTQFPKIIQDVEIKNFNATALTNIPKTYKSNGMSMCLIPALTDVHQEYAKNCSSWNGFFDQPIFGWVTGINLADLGKVKPKVINGSTGDFFEDQAVVMYLSLPQDKYAKLDILNLFTQGGGDTITFDVSGFEVKDCLINGKKQSLAKYVTDKKINTQLPLVADYMGAMINVSFQVVDAEADKVSFYAPVFPGVAYKIAEPIADYKKQFESEISKKSTEPIFTCNCILNFLYAGLEGKKTGDIVGPITFGEIAYILLNQTMVYLTIENK